jgi:NAD(P)-dependent dehydrogenase (short-subunit alcohol dehydrogenase family)
MINLTNKTARVTGASRGIRVNAVCAGSDRHR